MRTTVSLPDPLLQSAKRRAAERKITLSGLIEDALRSHLARPEGAAAPAFRLHTVRGKGVNPNLDLDRTSALVAEEDEVDYADQKDRPS